MTIPTPSYRHGPLHRLCWIALALVALWLPTGTAQARQSIHAHYYGYIQDHNAAQTSTLHVWSKAHHIMYRINVTSATVVHRHGQSVARSALAYGEYVIVTCTTRSGSCTALRISIVVRTHHSSSSH